MAVCHSACISELACFTDGHGDLCAELLAHFSSIDEARDAIEDKYAGCYKSVADFAEELTEECTQVPENLARYIDYNVVAYDMEVGGEFSRLSIS